MKQDIMPEIEQMFQLATQFFNQADAFCKKNKGTEEQVKSLTQEVEEQASLIRLKDHEIEELKATNKVNVEQYTTKRERVEELETTINDLRKQLEQQGDNGCYWVSVDDDRKPLDFEMVVVETKSGVRYMQTYYNGFTSEVEYWMSLPENTNKKGE